jgi:hypothetical protein
MLSMLSMRKFTMISKTVIEVAVYPIIDSEGMDSG